jgi:hypothetical protein
LTVGLTSVKITGFYEIKMGKFSLMEWEAADEESQGKMIQVKGSTLI